MCWFQGVYELTKVLLRNYPKIGHVRVELIASMSWRRRLCDHSCLPSRHHPNEESWKDSRLIKTKSKSESSWSTHKAHKMYRGIKWSHGMASIVNYALCTNPWSSWEFFVGLGCGVQVQVKRASSSNASRRDQMLEAIVVTMDLWRWAEEWPTHSGVWGSNQLVFIEPTQSRKVVHLEEE